MKLVIVGGGFTGSTLALSALNQGHEVLLLERERQLGGVMSDHKAHGDVWFRNTHYLDEGTVAASIFADSLKIRWLEFDHHYGSYNDLFGEPIVSTNFAQVVVPKARIQLAPDKLSISTLAERLNCYGAFVSGPLLSWVRRWANPEVLSSESCYPLQVSRVFFRDHVAEVRRLKSESKLADDLLGLPRSEMHPPRTIERSLLPERGWSPVFALIQERLELLGAKLFLETRAKPVVRNNQLTVLAANSEFTADVVAWCSNPHPLVRAFDLGPLKSPVVKMVNALFYCESSALPTPHYWHVFSMSSSVTRIFAYRVGADCRLTVEALHRDFDKQKITHEVVRILEELGFQLELNLVSVEVETRYALISENDYQVFDNLEKLAEPYGFITGGWSEHDRNGVLTQVLSSGRRQGLI